MKLKRGDRIRLKRSSLFLRRGEYVVTEDQYGDGVRFRRLEDPDDDMHVCEACRHEVSRIANIALCVTETEHD